MLTAERVQHVNRIKGLLFAQGVSGYEPLRRDRRERLDALQTGDGRRLPGHLKAQIRRELDRLELLLEQIKAVEAERDALLATAQSEPQRRPRRRCCWLLKGIGPEFAAILWSEGLFRTSTTDDRSPLMRAWPRRPGKADRSIGSRASRKPAIRDCEQQ